MQEFAGRTAVITGGASGIGFGLARKCADEGMSIVLADIEEQALEAAVKHFEERQVRVLGVPANTMFKESVEDVSARAIAEFGKVHLLFNNAGVVNGGPSTPLWELADVDWDWVIGVNFYGVLYGLQAFVPHMIEHGEDAHIVNTASIAAFLPGSGPYGVSKHGVVTLTEGLIQDLRARNTSIGASVLCPGWVNTKISDAERNRPATHASTRNPDRQGLGLDKLLSGSKSPDELATQVLDAIRAEQFYILPHAGWDEMITDHAAAIVARKNVFSFDFENQTRRGMSGEDV